MLNVSLLNIKRHALSNSLTNKHRAAVIASIKTVGFIRKAAVGDVTNPQRLIMII